eukprot:maker-scaffold78_size404448-snap-gene-3.27 protein:Tk10217 transcript:maker-scaffold78_size404448-snap-gene-3.27-mRNA-1 annotation:"nuclear distribution protein nude-like 1"
MAQLSADASLTSGASPEAELQFWKSRAQDLAGEVSETKRELEEFQESSRELEVELETQLEQAEERLKDSRSLANRLKMENEQMKDKLAHCQREYHCQVTELQTELAEIKSIREQLSQYVRDLEQQNDDLERAKRSTLASLEDFEARLNVAIERNAFLESELDEKESLKAAVQRMKDETKDLKSELRVLAPRHPNLSSLDLPDNDKPVVGLHGPLADSNKYAADCETKAESASHPPPGQTQALTPSARISALNIVGDLLRKVGALELKLVSCRNRVRENATASATASSSTLSQGDESVTSNGNMPTPVNGQSMYPPVDRSNGLPRGASTPSMKKIMDSR